MFKIAIIGSGPAGLSAAAHAAELGVSHVLLEAEHHAADTIYKYQKGKHVMAEPACCRCAARCRSPPARARRSSARGTSEIAKYNVNLRHGAGVTAITGSGAPSRSQLANGEMVEAEHVVLAIGLQGNLRKLGVPGEDLPVVQYQLDDPEGIRGRDHRRRRAPATRRSRTRWRSPSRTASS